MKQILQNLKSGEMVLEDVPAPKASPGHLLVQTTRSLISAGTERMLIDFGRAGYLDKARQQPEKVKQVINKVRTDGIGPTLETVAAKLDQAIPLGYSNVGRVLEVGEGVKGFAPGDRVVSNGRHAEVVCVPVNLTARIPEGVDDETATFTVISSIALNGVRLLAPALGESVCVFGLGLIGLVACQLLMSSGVRVVGFDYEKSRVDLATEFGAHALKVSDQMDPVQAALSFSKGQGVDGVLVTAATKSHELIHQAAQMSRKRGRIVLTGVTGLNLNRADFYEKELSFQVSCSYGPGRYDPSYEEKGNDYPIGFVRWTEQRNFEAILDLLRLGRLNVAPLTSKTYSFDQAKEAYDLLHDKNSIGIILEYPEVAQDSGDDGSLVKRVVAIKSPSIKGEKVVVGVIGAGNFTQLRLLPVLKKNSVRLKWIASSQGITSSHAARKFAFENNTTDYEAILDDDEVNSVFITTRHSSHASLVMKALKAGKNVFVEKPLCITPDELQQVSLAYQAACKDQEGKLLLMVGFNRRFSALSSVIRGMIQDRQKPLSTVFLVNAGDIPADHWVQDPTEGGGRIIGEAVHFIDYLHFLTGAPISRVNAMKSNPEEPRPREDNAAITLAFEDGSIGQINYFSDGSKSYPKESMDLFFDGKILRLNNFKTLHGFGLRSFRKKALYGQDKGHAKGFMSFVEAVENGRDAPIPFESLINVHQAAFATLESMRHNVQISI